MGRYKSIWNPCTPENLRRILSGKMSDLGMLERFIEANGFTRYATAADQGWFRFLASGRDTLGYPNIRTERPPHIDHHRVFKRPSDMLVCLTYQPYQEADVIRAEVEQWAHERGLVAEVYESSRSWYYPGATCLVVMHLPGREIVLPE